MLVVVRQLILDRGIFTAILDFTFQPVSLSRLEDVRHLGAGQIPRPNRTRQRARDFRVAVCATSPYKTRASQPSVP